MRRRRRYLLLSLFALAGACAGRVPTDVKATAEVGDAAMVVAVDCDEATPALVIGVGADRFAPSSSTIAPDDIVRFDNDDGVGHTTSSWSIGPDGVEQQTPFWDAPLPAGAQRCFRFDEPGEYTFVCTLHPDDEQGSISVDDGTPGTGSEDDGSDLLDLGAGTIGRERSLEG